MGMRKLLSMILVAAIVGTIVTLPTSAFGDAETFAQAQAQTVVSSEAELFAVINAVPEGGSATIKVAANITLTQSIRYWTKHITIESDMSAPGAPFTIQRGTGWSKVSDTLRPWATGGYYPSTIEVGVNASDPSATSSITLKNIIIDDNNNPQDIDYEGMISAYASGIQINLESGAVLKNFSPSTASGAVHGVVYLQDGARCIMREGAKITNWKGGKNAGFSDSNAFYLFKSDATVYADFTNETIANGGNIAHIFGGNLDIKSSSTISGNDLADGSIVRMKDTGTVDGGIKPATVNIEGKIFGNKVSKIVAMDCFIPDARSILNIAAGSSIGKENAANEVANIIDATGSQNAEINIDGAIEYNKIKNQSVNLVLGDGIHFTLGANGSLSNNTMNSMGIYAANSGAHVIDIYGKINNNTSPERGVVLFMQKGAFNIYPGAQINDNCGGGEYGGIIEMNGTGAPQTGVLTMYGGEIKGNVSTPVNEARYAGSQNGNNTPGAGTIHLTKGAHMVMKDGVISGNTALVGGAVMIGSILDNNTSSSLIVEGGTITGNTASSIGASSPYPNVFGNDIAICAPVGALFPNNNVTMPEGGKDKWTGDYGNNFVQIAPSATVGDIGIQNKISPMFGLYNFGWNQQIALPATRTETLAVSALPQYANTGVIDTLKDGITNTQSGYAKDLTPMDAANLKYDGNIWMSVNKASGSQKVSLNYPVRNSGGTYAQIPLADRGKYEYVIIYQAIDQDGNPMADAKVVRPARGANSLDFGIEVTSGAHAYGVVKYYYDKTSILTLNMTHSHEGNGAICTAAHNGANVFFEKSSGSASPLTFTYNTANAEIAISNAVITAAQNAADGKVTLKATPLTGHVIDSITLTAGDGTIKTFVADAKGEIELSYYDLSVPAGAAASNTINAVLKPMVYTVVFKDWDGKVIDTQSATHGTAITAPSNPVRDGYTFTGWDKSVSSLVNVTSDLTYTATYTKNDDGGNGGGGDSGGNGSGSNNGESNSGSKGGGSNGGGSNSNSSKGKGSSKAPVVVAPTVSASKNTPVKTPTPAPAPAVVSTGTPATPIAPAVVVAPVTPTLRDNPVDEAAEIAAQPETIAPPAKDSDATIEQGGIPLYGAQESGSWSLFDLILTIAGIILSAVFVLLWRRREDESDTEKALFGESDRYAISDGEQKRTSWIVLSIGVAVFGGIVFLLTQDMRFNMVLVDKWTIVYALLVAVELVVLIFAIRGLGRRKSGYVKI